MAGQSTKASWSVGLPWSPVCFPARSLLSSDTGGPSHGQGRFSSLLSWEDHSGASGSLVRNDDQGQKVGLDEEGLEGSEGQGALVLLWARLELGMGQGLPHQPSCSAKWTDWEGSSGRRGHFPGGRSKPCCSGGCGPSCHA